MSHSPPKPIDVPPFQVQRLISGVFEESEIASGIHILCGQAIGSEIYVGCSNGELIRYGLRADDPNSHVVISRQTLPGGKPIDEIVLIPSLSKAFVLSDRQIHFYTIPSLDPCPIKPIRHVVTFAVDDVHLKRPPPSAAPPGVSIPIEPVDFSVVKRSGIAMFTLKDRLVYQKEIPLPHGTGATLARRTGRSLCLADQTYYNMVDLEGASLFPLLPLSQAPEPAPFVVKPSITVINPNEFLILSWTGASTLGLFVTGDGDPVRGTLQWPNHPLALSLDYPYIMSLLPNNTVEIHSVETQSIVQVIGAPPLTSPSASPPPTSPASHHRASSVSTRGSGAADPGQRTGLVSSVGGYLVPSTQRSDKMKAVSVRLLRT